MAKNADWLPHQREKMLEMSKVWYGVLFKKAQTWGIPDHVETELENLTELAQDALADAAAGDSGKVSHAKCAAAFKELADKMRMIKRLWFHSPPLADADYISLGLKPPDANPTPIPPPTGFPEADVSYPGVGVLTLHPRAVKGQPPLDPDSDYGYRIYWGAYPPGGASVELTTGRRKLLMKPPETGDDLPFSKWTRKHKVDFDRHEDRGSTVYFCIRYENRKGDYGPWGPMFTAIVP
jgi:hypothetical protein